MISTIDMANSTSELEMRLEELILENEQVMKENELYESYLRRVTANTENDEEKREKGKKRKARVYSLLSIDQKNNIANSELEELQKEIEETKKTSEKLVDTLRAVLEETDIRIAELKKDAYEFKRDIVVGAENFRTGKTMAEKVIRYMEDKLRQKDSVIEKLKLKNATLKSQIQKVDAQLKQKEEMGDVLHYIDFHQLQIENKQYVAKIEDRNQELLKLKMTTGNTVQVLNNLKKRLSDLLAESEWLQREIKVRRELRDKIRSDNKRVNEEIVVARRDNRGLSSAKEGSEDMPSVLDYVKQKADMYELQKAVRNWERKLEIAQMAAKQGGSRK